MSEATASVGEPEGRASILRAGAQAIRGGWRRIRFTIWTSRLRIQVRRSGGRVVIEAPHGAAFDSPPRVKAKPTGSGTATTILRIGRDVDLGRDLNIDIWAHGTNLLELGSGLRLETNLRMQVYSGSIRIGPNVELRDGVKLKSAGEMELREGVIIGHNTTVHCAERVVLAELVGLAELVSILDSDHEVDGSGVHHQDARVRSAPVELGRNVFVARGAVVLKGVTIGDNSVVASNAAVSAGTYDAGWIIGGIPAKPIRPLPAAAPDDAVPATR